MEQSALWPHRGSPGGLRELAQPPSLSLPAGSEGQRREQRLAVMCRPSHHPEVGASSGPPPRAAGPDSVRLRGLGSTLSPSPSPVPQGLGDVMRHPADWRRAVPAHQAGGVLCHSFHLQAG